MHTRLCVQEYGGCCDGLCAVWFLLGIAIIVYVTSLCNELFNINHHSVPLYTHTSVVLVACVCIHYSCEQSSYRTPPNVYAKKIEAVCTGTFTRARAYFDKFQDFWLLIESIKSRSECVRNHSFKTYMCTGCKTCRFWVHRTISLLGAPKGKRMWKGQIEDRQCVRVYERRPEWVWAKEREMDQERATVTVLHSPRKGSTELKWTLDRWLAG